MVNNTEGIEKLFKETKARLVAWLSTKPTGSFSVEVSVNEGGLRGNPKISIAEKLK